MHAAIYLLHVLYSVRACVPSVCTYVALCDCTFASSVFIYANTQGAEYEVWITSIWRRPPSMTNCTQLQPVVHVALCASYVAICVYIWAHLCMYVYMSAFKVLSPMVGIVGGQALVQ